jgi:hypothetical protein
MTEQQRQALGGLEDVAGEMRRASTPFCQVRDDQLRSWAGRIERAVDLLAGETVDRASEKRIAEDCGHELGPAEPDSTLCGACWLQANLAPPQQRPEKKVEP